MYRITTFLLLCLLPFLAAAQTTEAEFALQTKLDSLEKRLDERNYTRVPNEEFDEIMELKVRSELNTWLDQRKAFILGTVGIVSFLLGFLVKFFVSESSRKMLEKQVAEKTNTLDSKIDAFTTQQLRNFNDLNTSMERVVNNLTKDINKHEQTIAANYSELNTGMQTMLTTQKVFMEESKIAIDKKLNDSLGFLWDDIANGMIERAEEKKHKGEILINGFRKLLSADNIKISDDVKIVLIDSLMRCYYHSKGEKYYQKMIELIKTYEQQYDLMASTYVNASIALCNYYEYYVTKEYRDACIENCDKAVSKLPDYGIPYAIKMQIFLIDYVKAGTPEQKQKAKEEVLDLFACIEKSKSQVLKGEFLERMILDKKVPYLKEYLEVMEQDFYTQLNRFKETVVSAISFNQDVAVEKEISLLNNLLTEGLSLHPNIDGTWRPTQYTASGEQIGNGSADQFLIMKNAAFTIYNESEEKGYTYFLPGVEKKCINLIFKEGTNKNKVVKAIYDYPDENHLNVCYGMPDKERPEEFLSSPENGFTLVNYERAND